MRPVDKQRGDQMGYNPGKWWTWARNSSAWTAVSSLITPPDDQPRMEVSRCLQLVLDLNVAAYTPADKAKKYGARAEATIGPKAEAMYKTAAAPLVKAIGAFCSYCETSVPGLLDVEHVASKSNYPTYWTSWENFLLACGPCNIAKRDLPTRAQVAPDPPPPPLEPNANTDLEFYRKIREIYRWPDRNNDTYQYFPIRFQMSEDGGATWQAVSLADASDLDPSKNYIVSQDLHTRLIWADISWQGGLRQGVLVRTIVTPEADGLVMLCGLNRTGLSGGNETYDRRAYNRTLAWFAILAVMRPLATANEAGGISFADLWPIVQHTSVSIGFWSLWVTLLSQYPDPDEPARALGYWLYADPNATRFYPGTRDDNIVLNPDQ